MLSKRGVAVGILLVWVIIVSLGIPGVAFAQTVNGAMHGTVTDGTGAAIPDASVKVTNLAIGLVRVAAANSSGFYVITELPPGQYSVTVSKPAFATAVQERVELLVNQDLEADYTLKVGNVTERVEVNAAPPALETANATLGQVIGSKQVVDLPLNGRQFTQLVLLTPGAAPKESGQQQGFVIPIGGGGISPSVNGQRGQQNNFTVDGVLNNNIYTNTWAISPPPDAIQEFNVQSQITDAKFSISSGANVNVVTRPGSNELHGSVWEFLRNDKFDAANFFDNFAKVKKPAFRQNQYGVTVGGPVMLPTPLGLYDGRKARTYFSGYWEGFRSTKGFTLFNNVPTAAELGGNFSDLLTGQQAVDPTTNKPIVDPLGRPVMAGQIYNPNSTRMVTAGQPDPTTGLVAQSSGFVRDPFPGNAIPTALLNTQALTYLKAFYPLPNFGPGGNSFPNLATTSRQVISNDQFGVRMDHTFSNNDTLSGNFYYTQPNETFPNSLLTGANTSKNHARVVALGYAHLFSPSFLMSLHYGYNYTVFGTTNVPGGTALLDATNTAAFEPVRDGIPIVPQISLSPRLGGTSQFAIPLGPIRSHQINADFEKIRGSHTFSAGFMLYHIHSFDDGWGGAVGFDQFPTSGTYGTNLNASQTGDGLASMLLNLPSSLFAFVGNTAADDRTTWQGYYVQDKWQASKKLNIQIGLRYDFVPPVHYKDNHVSGWNPNCPIPPAGSLNNQTAINQVIESCFLLPVPFVQPPTAANPNPPSFPFPNVRSTYFDPQYGGFNTFQPRFGFAYTVLPGSVIRGAFAMFTDHNNTLVQESQDPRIAWPFGAGISQGGLNRAVPTTFWNALPAATSFLPPVNPTPQFAFGADPILKVPYSMEYNLSVQHAFSSNLTATVGYVGSESRHLFIQPMYNAPLPSEMGPGPVAPRTPFPFLGQFPVDFNQGIGNYNALQAKVEQRFSHGLTFLGSYTYSRCLSIQDEGQSGSIQNPYNVRADYGPCDFNIPHIFVFSFAYALPFGKGQALGSNFGRAGDLLIGGWQMSGIATLESGQPSTVDVPFDNANINPSSETQRGDPVPGVALVPPGFKQGPQAWYNPAAFTVPPPFTYGTLGRNTLRGPKFENLDFALFKNFKFTESKSLQFRSEFFNVLNNVNFAPPGGGASGGFSTLGGEAKTHVGAPGFMQIFSAAAPREIQFSLKLLW